MNRMMMIVSASALCVAGALLASAVTVADEEQARPNRPAQDSPGRGGMDFTMLVNGLESTPGCLGTEVAQFQSGKLSIIAWFENKAAAVRWYEHPVHRGARAAMFPEDARVKDHVPLAHIEDETMPLMVIATITPARQPAPGGSPIDQISIELYQAAPGGLAAGGRLAPDDFEVPHMIQADAFSGPSPSGE